MRVSIDLDRQFRFGAEEIDDVRSDGVLFPKVGAVELASAHSRPQFLFGRREFAAKFTRTLLHFFGGLPVGSVFMDEIRGELW